MIDQQQRGMKVRQWPNLPPPALLLHTCTLYLQIIPELVLPSLESLSGLPLIMENNLKALEDLFTTFKHSGMHPID
jgi:hypothetical protein